MIIVTDITKTERLLEDTATQLKQLLAGDFMWVTSDLSTETERAVMHERANSLANVFIDVMMLAEDIKARVAKREAEASELV